MRDVRLISRVQSAIDNRGSLIGTTMSVVMMILLCQFLAVAGVIDQRVLPSPVSVMRAFWDLLLSGQLVGDILASVQRVLVGYSLAALLGISLGVLLGTIPILARRVRPLVEMLRPVPPIAWIPLAILWFGIGDMAAYFIVLVGAFFPIFVNTYAGVVSVRPNRINAARCLGAGRWLIATEVLLPASLPSIITGLRVGVGIAWTSVIAAELVGVQSGLGYLIQLNRIMLELERVIAGMIIIGVVGWMMSQGMSLLGAKLTAWNQDPLQT